VAPAVAVVAAAVVVDTAVAVAATKRYTGFPVSKRAF
jgi:hypothetical protein